MADSADAESYTAMYEYIPIDVHVPVLDLPDLLSPSTHSNSGSSSPPVHLDSVPYPPTRSATLSRAVIQGNLETARRDYLHIFRDLVELLTGAISTVIVSHQQELTQSYQLIQPHGATTPSLRVNRRLYLSDPSPPQTQNHLRSPLSARARLRSLRS